MPALFDYLYREYCRTRLAEMRKQLLLVESREGPETNCDAEHADGAADRGAIQAARDKSPAKLG